MDDDTQEPTPLETYTANLLAAGKIRHAPLGASGCPECGGGIGADHVCTYDE